ncbi:MAG: DUF2249 domain-containing protein [Moritella sp.]|uniref:DUF2249 domain-containing protein n=1 Tax=Moritella sp. TaxID=78556 RepID=UPI0029A92D9B|nr:DUF2249 domain-containing protein [Moritella sp.]MDX2322459.1 DUF2249 domain-containing protein [Moritella sp.]
MVKTGLQTIHLDVSELEAPEPMRQILQALAALSRGQCLIVQHRKNPVPLYPKLIQLGFAYRVDIRIPGTSTFFENQTHKQRNTDGSCEDLAVVISIALKVDELALAALSEV